MIPSPIPRPKSGPQCSCASCAGHQPPAVARSAQPCGEKFRAVLRSPPAKLVLHCAMERSGLDPEEWGRATRLIRRCHLDAATVTLKAAATWLWTRQLAEKCRVSDETSTETGVETSGGSAP